MLRFLMEPLLIPCGDTFNCDVSYLSFIVAFSSLSLLIFGEVITGSILLFLLLPRRFPNICFLLFPLELISPASRKGNSLALLLVLSYSSSILGELSTYEDFCLVVAYLCFSMMGLRMSVI